MNRPLELAGAIYFGFIAMQLFLSLVVVPITVPRLWRLLGYEPTLDDGDDICVFMLCTFLLPLAPITLWIVMGWIFIAGRDYRLIKSLDRNEILKLEREGGLDLGDIYIGLDHLGLKRVCLDFAKEKKQKHKRRIP